MSLASSIAVASAGLQVTQAQIAIVSGNVANVQTPGYTAKTLDQVSTAAGGAVSVATTGVNRQINQYVQSQLWTETSGGTFATTLNNLYQQIQQIIGQPGSPAGLDTLLNTFTSSLQTLATSPSSYSAQTSVLSAAQQLTQQLNASTQSVQGLRETCEQGIASDVTQVNSDLQQIAKLNQSLAAMSPDNSTAATVMDQRDNAISNLSNLMNVRVVQDGNNQVTVYAGSGQQLVGTSSAQLTFNARNTLTASSQWSSDPSESSVGSITLVSPNGATTDLIQAGAVKSGEIGAYIQMRDQILPQAQSQLDEFAAQMSRALSNQTTNANPVTSGAQSGFDADISGLQDGNSINIAYTDTATNTQRTISLVRVDTSSVLPLSNSSSDPSQQVIGIDFSKGIASVTAQISQALSSTGLQVSNPSGTTLRVLDDGATNHVRISSLSTTTTVTGLTSGSAQLPLFTDGATPFSDATTAAGSQTTGYAGRIAVNSALLANPSLLVNYQPTGTAAGDSTRPYFLYGQLTNSSFQFAPAGGIGAATTPYSGSLSSYLSQIFSVQGQAASNATSLQQGQTLVVNALQQRMSSTSGVSIDTELSNLLTLQNSYAANAQVLTAIKAMFTALNAI